METGWAKSEDPLGSVPAFGGYREQTMSFWPQEEMCGTIPATLCGGIWRLLGGLVCLFGKTTGTFLHGTSSVAHKLHDPRNPRIENLVALLATGTPEKGDSRQNLTISRGAGVTDCNLC